MGREDAPRRLSTERWFYLLALFAPGRGCRRSSPWPPSHVTVVAIEKRHYGSARDYPQQVSPSLFTTYNLPFSPWWAVLVAVDGIGPVTLAALLAALGSGRAVLSMAAGPAGPRRLADALAAHGGRLDATLGRAIADAAQQAPEMIRRVRELGIEVLTIESADYPKRLRLLDLPPPVLFVRGDIAALDHARSVAVVGTRRATERGRRIAGAIGGALSTAGAVVISGLAIGIDGAAHAAAVATGGRTVAVLGSGHRRLYPRAHAHLADEIVARGGAVVSELAPDVGPLPGTFPRRNRVISGLADATVIVEAGERSGALITASWTLEQGRECFVVPGPIDVEQSVGCNRLLRLYPGQARAVPGVAELLEDLGLVGSPAQPDPGRRTLRGGRAIGPDPEAILAGLGAAETAVAGRCSRARPRSRSWSTRRGLRRPPSSRC